MVTLFLVTIMFLVDCPRSLAAAAGTDGRDCHGTARVWRVALKRIAAGEVRAGVRMLDSLRRLSPCFDDSLLTLYARIIAEMLLPEAARSGDSVIILSENNSPFSSDTYFSAGDAEVPEGQRMTILPPFDPRRGMPSFAFDRLFTIREHFRIWLPPLQEYQHSATEGLLRYDSCRVLPGEPLLYHPGEEPWKVQLKIVVDCSEKKESLYEYVGDLVISRYDYIRVSEEQALGRSVSLRCYTQQVFRSRPGTFLGLVAFDRYGEFVTTGATSGSKETDRIRLRYLIMVKANRSVEEKAQLLLRRTVEPFRSR